MLRSLPLIALFPFCVSCVTYQFSTVSSNVVGRNDKNEFVYESDSLRLVYNFYGDNGPVNITIHNKLQVPVYIDWKRSALIVNGNAVSYSPDEIKINGNYHGDSYNFGRRSGYEVNSGHLHANASLPPSVDFMPPMTFLTKNPLAIINQPIESIPDTAFHRFKFVSVEGVTVSAKKAQFTEESSPLRFRSFLTYMVGEPAAKPQSVEHSFYVSEIMNSGSARGNMLLNPDRRGNQFYIGKVNGTGVAIGTVTIGAVLMAAAVSASQNNDGD